MKHAACVGHTGSWRLGLSPLGEALGEDMDVVTGGRGRSLVAGNHRHLL